MVWRVHCSPSMQIATSLWSLLLYSPGIELHLWSIQVFRSGLTLITSEHLLPDGSGTNLGRRVLSFLRNQNKQGQVIDPVHIANLITGSTKKETWSARIKIPPGILFFSGIVSHHESDAKIRIPRSSTASLNSTMISAPRSEQQRSLYSIQPTFRTHVCRS